MRVLLPLGMLIFLATLFGGVHGAGVSKFTGWCLDSNGQDQNSGTTRLNNGNVDDCYRQCKAVPLASGCEHSGNSGQCIYHTHDVASGGGSGSYTCLDFKPIGCNGVDHGVPCCPNYVNGDLLSGPEKRIPFSPKTEAGCQETCKREHPTSIGVTQHQDGKSSCYCEFGTIPKVGGNAGVYKTCVFGEPSIQCMSACEHHQLDLKCPKNHLLSVTSAMYGRQERDTCPSSGGIYTTDCESSASMSTVEYLCGGENSCSVKASNSVFGDPCRRTQKYLKVCYTCKEARELPSGESCHSVCQKETNCKAWTWNGKDHECRLHTYIPQLEGNDYSVSATRSTPKQKCYSEIGPYKENSEMTFCVTEKETECSEFKFPPPKYFEEDDNILVCHQEIISDSYVCKVCNAKWYQGSSHQNVNSKKSAYADGRSMFSYMYTKGKGRLVKWG